jgi:hypothetical protein
VTTLYAPSFQCGSGQHAVRPARVRDAHPHHSGRHPQRGRRRPKPENPGARQGAPHGRPEELDQLADVSHGGVIIARGVPEGLHVTFASELRDTDRSNRGNTTVGRAAGGDLPAGARGGELSGAQGPVCAEPGVAQHLRVSIQQRGYGTKPFVSLPVRSWTVTLEVRTKTSVVENRSETFVSISGSWGKHGVPPFPLGAGPNPLLH